MAVWMIELDVSSATNYLTQIAQIPFMPKRITVINMDSVDDVYVSLDGQTNHGHLTPGTPSAGLVFEQALQVTGIPGTTPTAKVYVKRGAVGTAPTNVQIIAET